MKNTGNKTQIFVIANPAAGSSSIATLKECLEKHGRESGKKIEFYQTQGNDPFPSLVTNALLNGAELFVVAGGDGTVSAVASELVGRNKPLAIIPCGTANVLAKCLNIPKDINQACRLALEASKTISVDCLEVGERRFFSHISLGAYSKIAEKTPPKAKKIFGRIAYIWSGLRVFIQSRLWKFKMEIDGLESSIRASTIMIANAGEMGAKDLSWGKDIRPDDGIVNICVIKAKSALDYFHLSKAFVNKEPDQSQMTKYFEAKKQIRISGPKNLPIRGDGEIIAKGSIEVRIHRNAIDLVCGEVAIQAKTA